MKVVIHSKYGPPDELQIQEMDMPVPMENEVLVKIRATTVTSSDCNLRNFTFTPELFLLPMRMQFGFKKPKNQRLGIDLAGEIEAVGSDVTRFKTGDPVFGTPDPVLGTHAEYFCMPEDSVLTEKPANTTWEETACIPLAGNTALYFIRDLGNIQEGQHVLIHGASGGIGTFAVQLAKYYGAQVTGVCSTTNVEMVKSLKADHVIDYTKEDFTKSNERYDVIFDVVGKTSFSSCIDLLKENGIFMTTLPTMSVILQSVWTSMRGKKKVKFGDAVPKVENLIFLRELVEAGNIRPVVGRTFTLDEIVEAFRYVEGGHKKGNVAVTVVHDEKT